MATSNALNSGETGVSVEGIGVLEVGSIVTVGGSGVLVVGSSTTATSTGAVSSILNDSPPQATRHTTRITPSGAAIFAIIPSNVKTQLLVHQYSIRHTDFGRTVARSLSPSLPCLFATSAIIDADKDLVSKIRLSADREWEEDHRERSERHGHTVCHLAAKEPFHVSK